MGDMVIMFVCCLLIGIKENVKISVAKIDVTITYGEKLKRKIRKLF